MEVKLAFAGYIYDCLFSDSIGQNQGEHLSEISQKGIQIKFQEFFHCNFMPLNSQRILKWNPVAIIVRAVSEALWHS